MYNHALIEVVLPVLVALPILSLVILFRVLSFNQSSRIDNRRTQNRIIDVLTLWFLVNFAAIVSICGVYLAQTTGWSVNPTVYGIVNGFFLLATTVWIFFRTRDYD